MDDIAREEAFLTEHGFDVQVLVSESYYQQPSDLLDARFIDVATEAAAQQAREVAEGLTRWWNEQ